MIQVPIKRLSLKIWLQIFAIWTMVAVSLTTQIYLNYKLVNPETSWTRMLFRQLPTWYLCALLTPVIMYFYDRHPLDTHDWKKNLIKQGLIAIPILLLFSHLRLWAVTYSFEKNAWEFSFNAYLNSYLSQLAWDLAIYILITVAIFADKSNRKQKTNELYAAEIELRNKELTNQLNAAQLEALRLQLSPHFLFNTLNTVSALVRAQENAKSIQVITSLGDFLRTTLYENHRLFVSLEEEIKFMDLYLGIELLRFSDRLVIQKEISTNSLLVQVPHFILQPIIENAVKHGVAKSSEAKLISIKSSLVGNTLGIKIYNEGTLLSDNWKMEEHWGIGLRNVSARLVKIYGDQYNFLIHNHIDRKGVEVLISIPT